MDLRQLTRLKERLKPVAERLQVRGTDLASFRERLECFRQRPVYFVPFSLGPEVIGLWVATDTADYVFYEQDTTPYHQRHIILHEGSHMLQGHHGPALPDLVSALTLHLDPKLVRSLLCRSVFDEQQEAEAEVLATLIEEHMDEYAPPRFRSAGDQTVKHLAKFLRETR
jgi:hypothetical protein